MAALLKQYICKFAEGFGNLHYKNLAFSQHVLGLQQMILKPV